MDSPTPTDDHPTPTEEPKLSQDATVVLALARTALPFARTRTEEAERWLRVMRMHGHVGAALQALGVGEGPLDSPSEEPDSSPAWGDRRNTVDTIELVSCRAMDFARQSGAECVGTVHVLFAVLDVYGWAFDHELYRRGTSRDEIFARLAAVPAGEVAAD
jgi:hypothetical protein